MAVYSAGTIADLEALTGSFAQGDVVILNGYHTAGDGGGGHFYFEGHPPAEATITAAVASSFTIKSATAGPPIVIETTNKHNFVTGQAVLISAAGAWLITQIDSYHFSLDNSAGLSATSIKGTVSSVVITTAAAHRLFNGMPVMIGGVSWNPKTALINRRYLLIGVISATEFSIPADIPGTYKSGGFIGDGGLKIPGPKGRWLRATDVFNVMQFGFVADGLTDNLPLWNAMLASIGPPPGPLPTPYNTQANPDAWNATRGIYFPAGSYFFSGPLHVYRSMHLYGDAQGSWAVSWEDTGKPANLNLKAPVYPNPSAPATALIFPQDSGGLVIEAAYAPWPGNPGGPFSQGAFSLIENLNLFGGYQMDTKNPNAQPSWTWVSGGPPVWTHIKSYNNGDIVRPSYFIPHGYAYQAAIAGVGSGLSSTTEPSWATGEVWPGTFSVVDNPGPNQITWNLIQAHGVVFNFQATMRNCLIAGFAGNGIHIFSANGSAPDCVRVTDCCVRYNGGSGLAVHGGDSSACVFVSLFFNNNGGWSVWDYSFLGNTHIGHHSSSGSGQPEAVGSG
jgi:hypothetical protein